MYWRIAVVLAVIGCVFGVYQYGVHTERQRAAIESAQNDGKAIQNRSKSDEEVLRDGAASWCIELGGLLADCKK